MTEPFLQVNNSYFIISEWKRLNEQIVAGFTTKLDGHSKSPFETLNLGLHVDDNRNTVIKNRETLATKLNVPLGNWVFTQQVHDAHVAFVHSSDRGSGITDLDSTIKQTDALVTNSENVLCAQLYADCVPLFFFEPQTNLIAIAHSGWKGTIKNIASEVVNRFEKHGAIKDAIQVVIGPCIQRNNYEVSKDVIDKIPHHLIHQVTDQLKNNRYLLDLSKLNELYLLAAGLNPGNIKRSNYCTYEEKNLFFSHRRDKGKTGRMLGFIIIKNDVNT